MPLEDYEEEVLLRMYDNQIIGHNYFSIQKVASLIKWREIARKYRVRKKFSSVIKRLVSKGYVDDHGKSGKAASLTRLGVAYVIGRRSQTRRD